MLMNDVRTIIIIELLHFRNCISLIQFEINNLVLTLAFEYLYSFLRKQIKKIINVKATDYKYVLLINIILFANVFFKSSKMHLKFANGLNATVFLIRWLENSQFLTNLDQGNCIKVVWSRFPLSKYFIQNRYNMLTKSLNDSSTGFNPPQHLFCFEKIIQFGDFFSALPIWGSSSYNHWFNKVLSTG